MCVLEFQTYLSEIFEVLSSLAMTDQIWLQIFQRPCQLLSALINADVDQPQRKTAQNKFRELPEKRRKHSKMRWAFSDYYHYCRFSRKNCYLIFDRILTSYNSYKYALFSCEYMNHVPLLVLSLIKPCMQAGAPYISNNWIHRVTVCFLLLLFPTSV